MKANSIDIFQAKKATQTKISMITCYDFWSAKIIAQSDIDCILVGDSGAMVMHGFEHTLFADMKMLLPHVASVARGAKNKFIIADMPFCSYRKGLNDAVQNAQDFLQAGAHAIKLEGAAGNLEIIAHLVESGIPVMGHLGLTAQSINTIGGYKIQGRDDQQAEIILEQARDLENAGCFSLVLECIPTPLATNISKQLNIPTIGIGAGPHTDGQVLVLQDMLGLNPEFKAKFVKHYLNGAELIKDALNNFHAEITHGDFPDPQHSFKE